MYTPGRGSPPDFDAYTSEDFAAVIANGTPVARRYRVDSMHGIKLRVFCFSGDERNRLSGATRDERPTIQR
jgi:hypothetical protein